ncbi:4Fe-4S cluster-binding domain-containing protein, partial [Clostridioides difficile]
MHPETKYIKYHIENNLSSIILQVTQNCNLRCDYCIYSGSYSNRVHTNKRMNIDVAKRSIDYLIKNSSQLNEVSVGFYGGEPLLEFDLIKQIVEYVKVVGEGKEIYFNLT